MILYGRQAELDILGRELDLATDTKVGRAVFLVGPAGAGKTALVEHFLSQLSQARPEIAIARGRSLQTFDRGEPYFPFLTALHDLSAEREVKGLPREKLGALIRKIAP